MYILFKKIAKKKVEVVDLTVDEISNLVKTWANIKKSVVDSYFEEYQSKGICDKNKRFKDSFVTLSGVEGIPLKIDFYYFLLKSSDVEIAEKKELFDDLIKDFRTKCFCKHRDNLIGWCYRVGNGVNKDLEKAKVWFCGDNYIDNEFSKSAIKEFSKSLYNQAVILCDQAFDLLNKPSKLKCFKTLFNLRATKSELDQTKHITKKFLFKFFWNSKSLDLDVITYKSLLDKNVVEDNITQSDADNILNMITDFISKFKSYKQLLSRSAKGGYGYAIYKYAECCYDDENYSLAKDWFEHLLDKLLTYNDKHEELNRLQQKARQYLNKIKNSLNVSSS